MSDTPGIYEQSYPPSLWETPLEGAAARTTPATTASVLVEPGSDPSTSTIAQVQSYVVGLGDPDDDDVIAETQRIIDAESAGAARTTLLSWLEAR